MFLEGGHWRHSHRGTSSAAYSLGGLTKSLPMTCPTWSTCCYCQKTFGEKRAWSLSESRDPLTSSSIPCPYASAFCVPYVPSTWTLDASSYCLKILVPIPARLGGYAGANTEPVHDHLQGYCRRKTERRRSRGIGHRLRLTVHESSH